MNSMAICSKELAFVHTFRPIHYFSRVCGMMPFTIVTDSNGELGKPKINKCDGLWLVISICLYLSMIIIVICGINLSEYRKSTAFTLLFGNDLHSILCLIFGIVVMAMDVWNRFKIVEILKMFTIFDKEVFSFTNQFNYKKEHRLAWMCSSVTMIVILLLLATSFHTYTHFEVNYEAINLIEYCCTTLLQMYVPAAPSITYIALLSSLYKRYAALNAQLSRFFSGDSLKVPVNVYKGSLTSSIKLVGRQHSFLTGIMDRLNVCYSFQIMVITASTFLFTVLTFYTFYRYIIQQNESFKELSWMHLQWQIFYLIFTLLVIYTANQVTSEGKKTSYLVHDIINQCSDPEVSLALTQLSLQIQNHYPIATCGLFVFDWTLLFTMGAATTTYLTILLNFASPTSENSNHMNT